MFKRIAAFVALVMALAAVPVGAQAEPAVIVTVTGNVAKPNRPAFDPFRDPFFKHHGITFDKAHAFTRPALQALGMHEIRIRYGNWPDSIRFRGPRLRDVLAAAGATGASLAAQALDGFAAAFPLSSVNGDEVILALEADGRALEIGGRGPAWLVYPPGAVAGQAIDKDDGLPWAVFHLKVE